MGLFGLLNYENYLLNLIVTSKFARNGLVVLLLYSITAIIRFHLSIILCLLFQVNTKMDLITPIIIGVIMSMASDRMYKYVETHSQFYESTVEYFITNYTESNFIRWKRILMGGICTYILLGLVFVQIDNYYIFLSIIQTAFSFIICDILDQRILKTIYNSLLTWSILLRNYKPSYNSLLKCWNSRKSLKIVTNKSIIVDYKPVKNLPNPHSLPNLPNLPNLPKLPNLPNLPNLPKLPNLPRIIRRHSFGNYIKNDGYDKHKENYQFKGKVEKISRQVKQVPPKTITPPLERMEPIIQVSSTEKVK